MNTDKEYHCELTAHLAAQEHPMPCPPKYDHGYVTSDMRMRDFGIEANRALATKQAARQPARQRIVIKWESVLVGIAWASFWGAVIYTAVQQFKGAH